MKWIIEVGNVIEYKNKYLLVKAQKSCKGCFFKNEYIILCDRPKEIHNCYADEKRTKPIIFKEISKIEALILQGDNDDKS